MLPFEDRKGTKQDTKYIAFEFKFGDLYEETLEDQENCCGRREIGPHKHGKSVKPSE